MRRRRRWAWRAFAIGVLLAAALTAPAQGQDSDSLTFARAGNCQALRDYLAQFPNGRHVAQARDALRARNCPDPAADAARRQREAAAAAERAQQERQRAEQAAAADRRERERVAADNARLRQELERARAFSLDLLHPDVRAAVITARAEAQAAEQTASQARAAATQAQAAATRARAGAAGHLRRTGVATTDGGTATLETEVSGGVRTGYGVMTVTAGPYLGNVHAGQWRGGQRNGLGVYSFAENPNNTARALRYEGGYANDQQDGRGVLLWRSGERYAGGWRAGQRSGHGVYTFADGSRYEGAWSGGKQNGPGVEWSAQGRVALQGVWRDGQLVTPLRP